MSYTSAEETEVVGEPTRLFSSGEFTVLTELVTQIQLLLVGVVSGQARFARSELFLLRFVLIVLGQ